MIDIINIDEDEGDWSYNLSTNPAAIDLLEANPRKINWIGLSKNTNPEVSRLFNMFDLWKKPRNVKQICKNLSENPAAITFLTDPNNKDWINWSYLSKNSAAIFLLQEEENIPKIL